MPALFTSTSSPSRALTAAGTMRTMSVRLDISQTAVYTPGVSRARAARPSASMSTTNTWEPAAANARAISRPMPNAPAVTNTRCFIQCSLVSDPSKLHVGIAKPPVPIPRISRQPHMLGDDMLMSKYASSLGHFVVLLIRPGESFSGGDLRTTAGRCRHGGRKGKIDLSEIQIVGIRITRFGLSASRSSLRRPLRRGIEAVPLFV